MVDQFKLPTSVNNYEFPWLESLLSKFIKYRSAIDLKNIPAPFTGEDICIYVTDTEVTLWKDYGDHGLEISVSKIGREIRGSRVPTMFLSVCNRYWENGAVWRDRDLFPLATILIAKRFFEALHPDELFYGLHAEWTPDSTNCEELLAKLKPHGIKKLTADNYDPALIQRYALNTATGRYCHYMGFTCTIQLEPTFDDDGDLTLLEMDFVKPDNTSFEP